MQDQQRLLVIGGGAAGLMAAGQAASVGAEVLLFEKMPRPARKLRITGKGRCNLTNSAPLDEFINHFGKKGRFLRSPFSRFFSSDLLQFFNSLGVETELERGGRFFPVSNQAQDIVDALVSWAEDQGVIIYPNAAVTRINTINGHVSSLHHQEPQNPGRITEVAGGAIILAVGGASYPGTGSSGDGFRIAADLGHTIIPIRPALVPLRTAGDTAQRLQGLSLRNIQVSVLIDGHQHEQEFGELLFTHFGISGPIILSLSRFMVDALRERKPVVVSIDLKPALSDEKLDERLKRDLDQFGRRQFHRILEGLLPRKLIPVCLDLVNIPYDKPAHQISSEERQALRRWLKDFRFKILEPMPISQALVTAGGVHLKEVNPKTMESRLVEGLYCAGEVLDLDGDTGGYNLQAAFSTGWVAGRAAATKLLGLPFQ